MMILPTTEAVADQITFAFTGTVDVVLPSVAGTFNNTQTVSGYYTFESTTPDSNVSPGTGQYGPLLDLSVTIGTYTIALGTLSEIRVFDNCCVQDVYQVLSLGVTGAPVSGLDPNAFVIHLQGGSNVFSDDSLPLSPAELSLLGTTRQWTLNFCDCSGFHLKGRITSFASVPEPSPLILLSFGLSGLLLSMKALKAD